MSQRILQATVCGILFMAAGSASAVPFNSFDPRSYAMGGTGVASGTSANAGYMNPALLAVAREEEDFALEFPVVGVRFRDRDDVIDEVDAYQNSNFESNLTTAIETYKTSPTDGNAAAVATEAEALWLQLSKLSNKAVQGEVNGGLVIGIPSKRFGAALTVNARGIGGGVLNVTSADDSLVNDIVAAGKTSSTALASNAAINDQVVNGNNVVDKLTSNMSVRGAVIQEVSLSLAREFNIGGHDVAIGLTPKYLKVTTFDYQVGVNTADFDADQGKKAYSDFNLDVGVGKTFAKGWKSGLVVKNLIAQDYKTVLGNTIKIEPQARAGLSHSTEWSTVAVDIDLNESDSTGFDARTQYAGFGVELDAWNTIQLRAGYRHNMSDSDTSIMTAGFGLSPFGVHIDVAVAGNDDEVGGSFQLGFRF
ncbi:MAG TPA: hypothetical protein ENJ13_03985 [Chromatiales bacterium]|nr:hypothetical protein [Chromatiales bacterium]